MSVRYYNFEKIHNDNLVVGYYIDKAIVKNENGYLFYIECDENEAPIGTIADEDMLTTLVNSKNTKRIISAVCLEKGRNKYVLR